MVLNYGWAGRILEIDLNKHCIGEKSIDERLALDFIGGRGLNSYLLYKEVKPNTDPLSPENILIFGTGPVTGTLSPGAGRFTVTAKSPLTGIFGDSSCGGSWGAELKFAGYDQMVVRGKANKPVYIFIDGDQIQIKDATHIWGMDTYETQEYIKKELGDPRIEVCCIGPAGENLVKFASIVARNRVAGRTGMGCVMGAKNLKAIAIRGFKGVKVADPRGYKKLVEKMWGISANDWFAGRLSIEGTTEFTERHNTILGGLAAYNARQTWIDPRKIRKIRGDVLVREYQVRRKSCFACTVPCSLFYEIKKGPYSGLAWDKIEFATIGRFTVALGLTDLEVALKAGALCDKYGMDTVSLGTALAWAWECYDEGIISKKETGGLELSWGNSDPIFPLIRMTAHKEGFGELLAEGVRRAAQIIGKGSEKYALHSKGLEAICADPRVGQGHGLSYAVSSRGFDHLRAHPMESALNNDQARELFGTEESLDRFLISGKGRMVKWFEDLRAIHDSLIICKWSIAFSLTVPPDLLITMLNSVTGLNFKVEDILRCGERIINVEKAFNIREGLSRKDDAMPERYLKEPIPDGPCKGHVLHLEPLLDQYYMARGWDVRTGLVPKPKLEGLGLDEIAKELEMMGRLPR